MASLAVELVVEILLLACGPFVVRFYGPLGNDYPSGEFLSIRTTCMLVCSRWRDIVVQCPAFWSTYIIHSRRRRSTHLLWVSRMKAWKADIRLSLDSSFLRRNRDDDLLTVQDVMSFVTSSAARCERLTVSSPNTGLLNRVTTSIARVQAPCLREISLVRTSPTMPLDELELFTPVLLDPPPGLSILRLSGVAISLKHPEQFHRLTTLVLLNSSYTDSPIIDDLHDVLALAHGIRDLSVEFVDCRPTTTSLSKIVMRSLERMTLAMSNNEPLARLLSCIYAPKLSDFDVNLGTDYDVDALVSCEDLLAGVTTLIVDGIVDRRLDVDCGLLRFFRLMPKVMHVDLRISSPGRLTDLMYEALVDIWPSLRTAVLLDPPFTSLELFVEGRYSKRALERISLIYVWEDQPAKVELDRVRDRVGILDLEPVTSSPWQFG
ncbi:hypothetical protein C8R47DRAFT_1067797 [Mycena vitilis]|nr:hypothetical protein C8R47DRAFT_1067797 [Mycena vitilis]